MVKPSRTLLNQANAAVRRSPQFPLDQRKQIYLPEFTITLIRTPFLPPRYASFWVPLTFNKLDLKDYLNRLYGVGVLSIRSYVEQQKPTRELRGGRSGYGKLRRPQSRKKMTVELKEPFVWPEQPEDMSPWEKENFFGAKKMQEDMNEAAKPEAATKEPKVERKLIAEQAEKLKEGAETWTPTWKALGLNFDRPVVGKGGSPGKK
ncbi:hypothetical protein FQN54_006250 [Arachnomyces sp. PD_36]|nr:hypothetical protein FQN54_006250 [Arachnomyces sp. PD_36]